MGRRLVALTVIPMPKTKQTSQKEDSADCPSCCHKAHEKECRCGCETWGYSRVEKAQEPAQSAPISPDQRRLETIRDIEGYVCKDKDCKYCKENMAILERHDAAVARDARIDELKTLYMKLGWEKEDIYEYLRERLAALSKQQKED